MCRFDAPTYCNVMATVVLANTSSTSHDDRLFFVVRTSKVHDHLKSTATP